MSGKSKFYLKRYITDVLIINGLCLILKLLWDYLEIIFDGGIQESISDSIIAFILVTLLWWNIRKWVNIKDKTYSD
ncbi:hypothetical protein CF055_10590 [Clostridium botulinum]|uniref:Uncharacterized protein n=1 Tax=Clostridium botulinum (strain 657 / Type Ba4) TaxID=515621 RepID=A0A3F3AD14_CLOB6|nr:hypothetical protein [Clostridium botulinum]ACQ55149.1 conserved hypothetical protein [Clostridium botulinum Ba4 str. 657]AUN19066.1 hypothetical protein B2M06_16195 [Clostridium botulinum]AXG91106.1 hypothetical protein AGE29_04730 [Clostridium botulinum]MBY6878487.1 hypothetical protein [Clostridium botulinum]OSA86444.1 hypothetical protein B2H91_10660 [Clostridium botulinum]